MNKKHIYIGAGILVVIILFVVGVLYKKKVYTPPTLPIRTATNAEVFISPSSLITNDKDKAVAHEAWLAFQKYIGFAKAHDIEGINNLTYKLSPTCLDPQKTTECNSIMDGLYALGSLSEEKSFTHVLYDSKQIILSSDYKKDENKDVRGYIHVVIYFIRNEEGVLKIVGFGPAQGRYLAKIPGQTEPGIDTALADRLQDTDQDGVPDYVEVCKDTSKGEVCVPTDPLKRDTDGDGYWDGIQKFLVK